MLLYLDDCFADHDTGSHPECIARIRNVNDMLRREGWLEKAECPAWNAASLAELQRVHDKEYIRQLESWCAAAAGRIEADTVVSTGSWLAATRGAGAAIDATQQVIDGRSPTAFCAIRPPGHHAIPSGPMGFCLLNNVAIAAKSAISSGLERVMIIDWDVHHGNGTQDTFYDDGQVAFFSIHRSPFYPGTGAADETGSGKGLGWTANAPVPADISVKRFFDLFQRGMEDLAARVQPELILLSAGFDAHVADPVGSLCLEEPHFAELTDLVKQVAATYCKGRIVSLLEGGYHLEHMPLSLLAHVTELAK